jgi:hypothetical protein
VRAFWRSAGAAACAVALAGCSLLSGRTTSDANGIRTPTPSNSSSTPVPRPQFTGGTDVSAALQAAEHDFETVFTYDYRDLGKYRAAGLKATASPYSATYANALQGKPGRTLVASKSVQVATSTLAALASLTNRGSSAAVIVSGSIATTSAQNPGGSTHSVTAVLNLRKVGSSWRITGTKTGAARQGTIPANPALRNAMSAARAALLRIYGLHRSSFAADYRKAVALTTGDLHDTMTSQEGALQQAQVVGKYDLSAKIVGFAALQPSTDASFVIAVDEYRIGRQGAKLGPYQHRLVVSTTFVQGTWLARSATPLS